MLGTKSLPSHGHAVAARGEAVSGEPRAGPWRSQGPDREYLPLVSREWKNGSNSSYHCTPFLHSLLTKGKNSPRLVSCTYAFSSRGGRQPCQCCWYCSCYWRAWYYCFYSCCNSSSRSTQAPHLWRRYQITPLPRPQSKHPTSPRDRQLLCAADTGTPAMNNF